VALTNCACHRPGGSTAGLRILTVDLSAVALATVTATALEVRLQACESSLSTRRRWP